MPEIRVRDANENKWLEGREFGSKQSGMSMSSSELSQFSEQKLNSPVRMHEPGSESTLQLFEAIYEPGVTVAIHSHGEDEIIYVVKGSLEFGKRSLGPGSSVFVGADTLYSFKAGPEGLQFLNFRPRKDSVYRTREQHMAYMKTKASQGEQSAAAAE